MALQQKKVSLAVAEYRFTEIELLGVLPNNHVPGGRIYGDVNLKFKIWPAGSISVGEVVTVAESSGRSVNRIRIWIIGKVEHKLGVGG